MDKHDNMCFEKEALVNVWIEYMRELYADDRVTRPYIDDESGPSITSTEVKHAIKKLKNNKAAGTDLIAAEMLKALDDGPLGKLTQLCNEIYKTGYWPKELKESIFIPIPKKSKATRCQEYRTIEGSTDRCCIAIVTNALLSGSDQPVQNLGRHRIYACKAGKQTFKDRHIWSMVYGALLMSETDTN